MPMWKRFLKERTSWIPAEAAVYVGVWERMHGKWVREQEERLIGILVLRAGRDARDTEIILLVVLNLNEQSARSTVFRGQLI